MNCDFATAALPDGHYRHVCRRPGCGRDVQTAAAACALKCRSGEQGAASREQDIELRSEAAQLELAAICGTNDCGAWDAVNEACRLCGCQSQRHEAWLAKLRVGDCPRKLWP